MRFQKMDLRAATIAAALTASLGLAAAPADAKVEGDTITLGAAMSLTGKYSTNGIDTQNGYQLALDMINKAGGVTVGGKSYKMKIAYYDDESTPARGAQLAERLINQDGVKFMLGPYSALICLLYTSPSPRDRTRSRMPSSA
eukprot:TRINITY_DN4053_c0_g1_i1.p1 TRINITY_DN4053_c0_g1~~TRINITY_DN4053_c0_g1_i1.p1  ORF type:complete len:142 (-),score=49.03 TRINITY_DN4053_c0_g1_i1:77-502(-)